MSFELATGIVYLTFTFFCVLAYDDKAEAEYDANPTSYPSTFDCPMRELALQFGHQIQPHLSADQLQEIADALNGAREAQDCNVSIDILTNIEQPIRKARSWKENNYNIPSLYVDYQSGNDNNIGSLTSPFKSLQTGLNYAAKKYGPANKKQIVLRGGRHYLADTVMFTPQHSNTIITNFNNEVVDVSAGLPLDCNWKLVNTKVANTKTIYVCDIEDDRIDDIYGLRVDGVRAIRARYPNANPEIDGFGSSLQAVSWYPSTLPTKPDQQIEFKTPIRNDTIDGYFQYYNLGIGGSCKNFAPTAGYWCSETSQGGGASMYKIPSGFRYNSTILPHAPYSDTSRMILQTWRPGHWSSWMFDIDTYDPDSESFKFKSGGFQGARGNQHGDEFYVENVREELDMPAEFYYDKQGRLLYYYNNQTDHDPSNLQFEVTNLKILFNLTGSQQKPISDVSILGLTFRDTQYTYMDPHGMPSGGDWGLERQGAVYLEGTRDIQIEGNLFTRLDGNAISINRYNRDITIARNEFVWIGDSCITAWGDTQNISFTGDKTTMGYDGTDGNQPRRLNIIQNFVHEIGIWEKQSSFYFQSKSCSNLIYANIFFNGPRAAINFNDGFGGNSTIAKNLILNTCRESGDHGPFNSWDRQVYVTRVATGHSSVIKAYDHIYQNFWLANYNSQEAVDNDDGSCYYDTHDNFMVYGGHGMKNDFGGHDNHHYHNIYAYVGALCFGINSQLAGHNDKFYDNTCVINKDSIANYGTFGCTSDRNTFPQLGNNVIHLLGTHTSNTGLCNLNEEKFQQSYPGIDDGTVILGPVDDQTLLQQAKTMLWQ